MVWLGLLPGMAGQGARELPGGRCLGGPPVHHRRHQPRAALAGLGGAIHAQRCAGLGPLGCSLQRGRARARGGPGGRGTLQQEPRLARGDRGLPADAGWRVRLEPRRVPAEVPDAGRGAGRGPGRAFCQRAHVVDEPYGLLLRRLPRSARRLCGIPGRGGCPGAKQLGCARALRGTLQRTLCGLVALPARPGGLPGSFGPASARHRAPAG
mmetsp:Transcript_94785/g.292220  ORF Transcript_94785/g.292220 Transcript_94785/m.292220 type:complete len:210 (-) Transcript_94785:59-688(-)